MKVEEITVIAKPLGRIHRLVIITIGLSFLVGTEATAHLLFGGSWVVDLVILVALVTMLMGQAKIYQGGMVGMTKAEIRA